MSSCLYSTIFINRGTRRTLCVHEKNDDDDLYTFPYFKGNIFAYFKGNLSAYFKCNLYAYFKGSLNAYFKGNLSAYFKG